MKHLYLFGLLLSLPFIGFPQKEFNNWYFGDSAGVSFNSGVPVAFLSSKMDDFSNGSSNISDSLGNILFYTNGGQVYNRNNSIMPNGWIWLGCSMSTIKQVIVFQKVDDPTKYYLFDAGCECNNGLIYSVIDMNLDGGLGDIPAGLNTVPVPGASKAYYAVTAARHHNNHDVWVVVRLKDAANNFYLSYLVNASGINFAPVVSNSHLLLPSCWNSHTIKSIKISRDGTKLAAVYDEVTEYCNFNSATGQVTPLFLVNLPKCAGGSPMANSVEFSINSKYLYISAQGGASCPTRNFLYQYDATITDSVQFMNSGTLICNDNRYHELQFAPDGKIYCSINYPSGGNTILVDSLSVINNPSSPGTGCNYQQNVLSLQGRGSGFALPDYVERYYVIVYDTGQCLQTLVHFSSAIWPPADSIHWNFGDPASGAANTSLLPNPSHTYPGTGQYIAELFVRHIDNRTDTTWHVVNILLKPNVGADQTICNGDSATFDAGACPGGTYLWKDLGSGLTVGTSQIFKTGLAGNYEIKITNPDGCTARDTVQLITTPVPSVTNNPLSKTICSAVSTNIPLTSSAPGTNFHWTASLSSGNITGFTADSGLVINQVLTNTLPTPGIVTYHITPKVGSCVGTIVDFLVTVDPLNPVNVSISASSINVCTGTLVTFTANPTNPGSTPVYQWQVNGINAGTNSPIFSYIPLDADLVSCTLTSSATCTSNNPASSNQLQMTVNPYLPVSVSVSASANPFCLGSPVTFTATPTHGGTTSSYQWKVNGANAGTNSPNFTYNPANGDLVYCILTSSEPCTSGNPASSITITMVENSNLPAGVSITASSNPFCPGSSVTFTATPFNGGTPSYQWKVNGVNTGINSDTFTYNPVNNDSVRCVMTSNLSCVTGNPASSNKIIMSGTLAPTVTFTSCFDTITRINAKPIKLKGGIPLGGTYSGPGVNSLTSIFTPALAGVGTHTITYTYTNIAMCSALAHAHIINYPLSIVNCGNPITDIRDNKVYQTIQIGTQCWLATNLNYGAILASSQDQRNNCIAEKYCYNDNPINCTNLGGLYQWDELMQFDETPAVQGFCPPGWHIPAENEWNTLFTNYINNAFAGSPLKYSGYSGFNALLSGARHINEGWDFQGFATFFWSSTFRSSTKAWAHGINDIDPSVAVYSSSRVNAFSVRCLKD